MKCRNFPEMLETPFRQNQTKSTGSKKMGLYEIRFKAFIGGNGMHTICPKQL